MSKARMVHEQSIHIALHMTNSVFVEHHHHALFVDPFPVLNPNQKLRNHFGEKCGHVIPMSAKPK